MKAWLYQDAHQVKKLGAEKASWYVGWIDPDGKRRCKSCGSGSRGKNRAEKFARKIEGQLAAGTYQNTSRKSWKDFRKEYEARILAGAEPGTRRVVLDSLKHFERLIKPARISAIRTATIDEFRAKRRIERGKMKGDRISPATVNKDLRNLRAVLRRAYKWGLLPMVPDFTFEREPKKLPTYVTGEHFAAIYKGCEHATLPDDLPFSPVNWWRALLTMAYMTGWRISELLALRKADLDLDAGTAVTRAADNKGKRDELIKLHSVVVDHLRLIPSFDQQVFPWKRSERDLYSAFARVQELAGIELPCSANHEHSRSCHVYGFHDFRRAFATMNADRVTPDALQALMRHQSYLTTQRYINMARQLDQAVDALHVPDVLRRKTI